MTKPIITEPAVDTEHTPAEYANAASRVAQAREQVLGNATAKAAHDALLATIEERLAAKHATLAEVRRAIGLTQNQIAESLGMTQGDVSKLERRDNLHLATLCRFIEATGGAQLDRPFNSRSVVGASPEISNEHIRLLLGLASLTQQLRW